MDEVRVSGSGGTLAPGCETTLSGNPLTIPDANDAIDEATLAEGS